MKERKLVFFYTAENRDVEKPAENSAVSICRACSIVRLLRLFSKLKPSLVKYHIHIYVHLNVYPKIVKKVGWYILRIFEMFVAVLQILPLFSAVNI